MALSHHAEKWNETRQTLLERVRDLDDRDSWNEFFEVFRGLIYAVALKAGLTDAEAQDVVQETFISVAKAMPGFTYDPTRSFKGLILTITRQRAIDQLRKRKHRAAPALSGTRTSATATIERVPDPASLDLESLWENEWRNQLYSAAVEKVKQKVDARQFQIFDLYVLKNWPVRKVASTIGISSGRVYLTKHRVLHLVEKEIRSLKKEMT